MKAIIALALSGWEQPLEARNPFLCNASDDYATEGEYATVGEDGYDTGAAAPRTALARPPARRPAPRPTATRPGTAPRPLPGGLTPQQVRAIVQEEIAARVPYGDVPPRPSPDEAMFPMGLGFVTLTSAVPTGTLEARPQRAFRGERLVLSIFRSSGAIGNLVLIDNFQVGDYKQLVGGGSLPADVFASDAFGVRLMLDASIPGVLYSIDLEGLAIPPAEFIIVAGCVIGRAGEAAQR